MKNSKLYLSTLIALVLLMVAVPPGRAQAPDRERMFLEINDLVTASGKGDVLIRLRLKKKRYKLTAVSMGVRLTPKAITSNKFCEKIAVANAHNVVTYDVWNGRIDVIEHESFGEIADVQYDWDCNLIIADMGQSAVGHSPRDGHLWLYTPEGELIEIGWRHKWSNPAFLDMDEWGTLYVVDKEAGPKIPGSGGWHFDAIYKLGAPRYTAAIKKFGKRGLNVSSFVHHPSGKFFIGNQDELLILEDDELSSPCAGATFDRINGLALNSDLQVFLLDGFDIFGGSTLYSVDEECNLTPIEDGRKLQGSQGLTAGLPGR